MRAMKLLWKLSTTLPMPELRRVAWQRLMTERAYEADTRIAKASGDKDKLESIWHLRAHEVGMYDEEEAFIMSRHLLAAADRLDVMRPTLDAGDDSEMADWERGQFYGRWALTPLGRAKLRDDIRKERKARHDDRIYWLAWIAPLTGVIGAITGLVAILTRK